MLDNRREGGKKIQFVFENVAADRTAKFINVVLNLTILNLLGIDIIDRIGR